MEANTLKIQIKTTMPVELTCYAEATAGFPSKISVCGVEVGEVLQAGKKLLAAFEGEPVGYPAEDFQACVEMVIRDALERCRLPVKIRHPAIEIGIENTKA